MRRKRNHIPILQLLAAALVEQLPPEQQAALRASMGSARGIVRMFTPDHIALHALGGSDRWHNLHMRPRGMAVLKKNAADTTVVAKVRRVASAHRDFVRRVLGPVKRKKTPRFIWPKRHFRSR